MTVITPSDTIYQVLLASKGNGPDKPGAPSSLFKRLPPHVLRFVLEEFLVGFKRGALRIFRSFRIVDHKTDRAECLGQRAMLLMGETIGHGNQGMTATLQVSSQELVFSAPEGFPQHEVTVHRALLIGVLPVDVVQVLRMACQPTVWRCDFPFRYKGFDPNLLPYQALMAGMCCTHRSFRPHVVKANPKWITSYDLDVFIGLGILVSWDGMGFHPELLVSDPTLQRLLSVVAALENGPLLAKFNTMIHLEMRGEALRAAVLTAIVLHVSDVALPGTLFEDEALQLNVYRDLLGRDATGRCADRIDHLTRFAHDIGERSPEFRSFVLKDITTSMYRWAKRPSSYSEAKERRARVE